MTAVLGKPLVLVKSTEPCEGGQCGGEVTLWTDLNRTAYAVSHPAMGSHYIAQDADLILRKEDGTIEVSCASVNLGDHVCDGTATFTHTDLTQHSEWLDPDALTLSYLKPMDRA